MASTSSTGQNQTRFQVFLSFRGEDTRDSFTDHLYAALRGAAIHTFRDNEEIRRGQEVGPEIEEAIKSSRAFIVVLSENYANSRWCLEELWLILQQRKKYNHFVLPVFYHVDPSDVRKQQNSFSIEGSKLTEESVNRWKLALSEIGNMAGVVASGPETKIIKNIVDKMQNELDLKLLSTPAHLIGIEARAEHISSWLKSEDSDTSILAICGMGGIGKTTLAQYIYNSNKHNFEKSCFVEEIGKQFKQTGSMLEIQNQLLTTILGGQNNFTYGVSEGTTKITEALRKKKMLIVLDDIDEDDELSALLGTSAVHTQSKIIITTRLLEIHSWFERIAWTCDLHKLILLSDHESLELFSYNAFGSKVPLDGFSDLARELAQYCGGNPLALKVLGSSLYVSVKDTRKISRIIESWKSTLNSLSSMKGDLNLKIQGVLQKSFDSLPYSSCKELFLHIAVFFVGEEEDYVVKILEHDWYAESGIMTLINRCLLTVSPNKKLGMHQLLQDMGRNIVLEESKDPARRSRIWGSDEAYHMLTKGDASTVTEGLTLDTRKLKKGTKVLTITTESMAKLQKLKLLQLNYVKLDGNYENFPELRWLCWHGFHLTKIPSGLLMSSLVAIDMSNGILEIFEPPTVLNSLKILDLKSCFKLISIRKLCLLPNLETLNMWDCRNLIHVCKTIRGLESLALLNLAGCKTLFKSTWNKEHLILWEWIGEGNPEEPLFCLPRSLKFLFLDFNKIDNQSDLRLSFSCSFSGLSLAGNLFESMPSIIDLKMLRVLNLSICKNLKSLLCLPSTLEELNTFGCISLEKITFQSARFTLQKFSLKGCSKICEVQGLFKLMAIEELNEADLGQMKWVKSYQDHKVDLVVCEIYKVRICCIQMLYEYGIRSIYLPLDIKDQSMMKSMFRSAGNSLSFRVSLHPDRLRVKGLNVSFLYRSSGPIDKTLWLFIEVSNITKGVTWIYNPVVYCKPRVGEAVMWLSYWPIGSTLDVGDEIYVSIKREIGTIVSEFGASVVYMDDGEAEQEEKMTEKSMEMEEVIGGDLSEFELKKRVYYLCRRDFFKGKTPDLVKSWFGDSIPCAELLRGWRKSHERRALSMVLKVKREFYRDTLSKMIVLGNFNRTSDISMIKKVVSNLLGVKWVKDIIEMCSLFVAGNVDPVTVETCVREFDEEVEILFVKYGDI